MLIDLTSIAREAVTGKSANQHASRLMRLRGSVRRAGDGDYRKNDKREINVGSRSSYEILSIGTRRAATLRG